MIRYDRIQELVNLCGKKKSFLSEAMGFSSRYLIDAKKQNTNIADEPLQILAKELKTTPEYLRGETDDPGIKETPATEGEGLSAARQKLYDAIANLTDEQCTKLLGVVEWAKENK